jgi:hypothetical protein
MQRVLKYLSTSALGHERTFHTLIRHVPLFGRNQTPRRDRLNVRLVPITDVRGLGTAFKLALRSVTPDEGPEWGLRAVATFLFLTGG